jgi:hypothetical protein
MGMLPVKSIFDKRSGNIMQAVLSKIANSMTVYYSEVFPGHDNEYFHLAYIGKLFLIVDSYCMNPDCTCQEAFLNFVQVYPREDQKPKKFMVRMKLNGRGFKIHDYGSFTKREIQAILMHFNANSMILKQLNDRHKEMREKALEILS